jgi:hypothetical protein
VCTCARFPGEAPYSVPASALQDCVVRMCSALWLLAALLIDRMCHEPSAYHVPCAKCLATSLTPDVCMYIVKPAYTICIHHYAHDAGGALSVQMPMHCLHVCRFGTAGARALGEGLASNETLQTLALPHCAAGADGIVALASALRGHRSLRLLDVSGNGAGAAACLALARTLASCSRLERLALRGSPLGLAGAQCLLQATAQCTGLRALDLQGCSFTAPLAGAQAKAIDRFVPGNPNGHYRLDLSGAHAPVKQQRGKPEGE